MYANINTYKLTGYAYVVVVRKLKFHQHLEYEVLIISSTHQ